MKLKILKAHVAVDRNKEKNLLAQILSLLSEHW